MALVFLLSMPCLKKCELEVRRDGNVYMQSYKRGVPDGPLEMVGKTRGKGTKVTFFTG